MVAWTRRVLGLLLAVGAGGFLFPESRYAYDSWLYHRSGSWFAFFIAGVVPNREGGNWDHVAAARSADAVHFAPTGPAVHMPPPIGRDQTDWVGSGAVWPLIGANRSQTGELVINYSGAYSRNNTWHGAIDYQRIYFATSADLVRWTPKPSATFPIDGRWYNDTECCVMRWDCMTVVCEDGRSPPDQCTAGYYGVFTASPLPTCPSCPDDKAGYGLAHSEDGLDWEALPPLTQGTLGSRWPQAARLPGGEVGSVSLLAGRTYIHANGSSVLMADDVFGPYSLQTTNPMLLNPPVLGSNLCTNAACSSFARIWDVVTAAGRVALLTNTRNVGGHTAWFDILKLIEPTPNGTLYAKWWPGNEQALRGRRLAISSARSLSGFSLVDWDITAGLMVDVALPGRPDRCVGFMVANGSSTGWVGCWLTSEQGGLVGAVELHRSSYRWQYAPIRIERGLTFDSKTPLALRLLMRTVPESVAPPTSDFPHKPGNHTLLEIYVNDYLLAIWTLSNASGRVGLVGRASSSSVESCVGCSAWAMSFPAMDAAPQ